MMQYNRGSQIAAQLANNAVTPAVQGVNLADAIDAFKGGMDWAQQYQDNQRAYNQKLALQGLTEDYGEAVKSGDTGLQNAILAQLDPAGYQRNQLLDRQMRQEQENWQRNFDANNVYKNAMLELQRQKAGQNGMTDKIRNYEYFAEKFGPERAALLVSPGSEAVGSALVSGGNNEFGLVGKSLDKYNEARAANIAAAEKNMIENEASFSQINNQINRLKADINANPDVVGPFSNWNEKAKSYLDNDPQWLERRGRVVNQIISAGNILVGQATASGVSGVNTLEEVQRIIANLKPDSSPSEIKGALDSMEKANNELNMRYRSIYSGYKKGKPYKEILDRLDNLAQKSKPQNIQKVGNFNVEVL